ncbi:flagellar basal body rod protein FlgB [Oceanospirillum multiglobuliferum]|uniref:Flagellar basal body rod protein FlgB n=1 Tax=Oceanospirillum multiglobuliferum TaxID=64969 RepID=A0A1V4T2H4_9GAMM|nr:flagellar basal body rod protein FlgB [Oceanospirillum multiglobuliferum]OPX54815.1 flagellar basal body rod protein FlgB [Oceanospirillum multiglobuliferum]
MTAISFKNALGIHPEALNVRSQRSEILANNIANSDTPGFKARDLDFQGILRGEYEKRDRMELNRTSHRHIPAEAVSMESGLKYRVPLQPSIDGNTVETDIEQAQYARNALEFQSSFTFLNSKFKGLTKALRSE